MGSAAAPLTHAPPGPRGRRGASPHILDATLGPVQKTRRFQGGGWRLEGPPLLLSNQPLRSQFPKRPRAGRGRGGPGRGGGLGAHWVFSPSTPAPPPQPLLGSAGRDGRRQRRPTTRKKIGPAGSGQKFPSALHSWAAKRAPAASPASDAPGLLPVLVTAPGAEVPPPPPPRCRLRSTPMAPTKTRTPPTEGQGNNTRGREPPAQSPGGGGRRDHQPRAENGEGAGLPAAPSRPAPSAREDQSPQSRARRMLPPRGPGGHPRASTPGGHPERAPPDTLRRRAGAVISALLGPRGTRKYVGEKFPLPHGGEDVGGERAEDGEQRW